MVRRLRAGMVLALSGVVLFLVQPTSLQGQEEASSRLILAGGAEAGLIVGVTQDFLDGGWGPWTSLAWRSDDFPVEGRLDLTWLRLEDDVDPGSRATNSIVQVLGGPVLFRVWGPVRPWLGILAGSATSIWETRVGSERQDGQLSSFAWGGALGVDLRVTEGRHPISVGGAARIMNLGELDFGRVPAPNQGLGTAGVVREDVRVIELRISLSAEL